MKAFSKIPLFLILAIFVFIFVACDRENIETTTDAAVATENGTTEPEIKIFSHPISISQAGINLDDLEKANSIYSLLEKYDVITVNETNDMNRSEVQIFNYDGEAAMTGYYDYEDAKDVIDGWIKGFNYEKTDNESLVRISLDSIYYSQSFPSETYLSSFFISYDDEKDLVITEEGADYYKMLWQADSIPEGEIHTFIFDKESLELREYIHTSGDIEAYRMKTAFDKELNEFSKGIIDDFDNNTKEITIVSQIYSGDNVDEQSITLTVPYDWVFSFIYVDELAIYSNADMSGVYEYPGHGVDHTIYVTNSNG